MVDNTSRTTNMEDVEQPKHKLSVEEDEDRKRTVKRAKTNHPASWTCRPPFIPATKPSSSPLVFMLIDVDFDTDITEGLFVRLYGVDEAGHSLTVRVFGFFPYFYVRWDKTPFDDDQRRKFVTNLDAQLRRAGKRGARERVIRSVRVVDRQSIREFQFDHTEQFLQIILSTPWLIPAARRILHNDDFVTFETNVPFILRFMVDLDIRGAGWIELKHHQIREESQSFCQYEVDCLYQSIIAHNEQVPRWLCLAPLCTLSFDIECAGRPGVFPDPDVDPVIQIANVVTIQGQAEPLRQNVFCLHGCTALKDAQVFAFEREEHLLQAWTSFVRAVDPDILTGYNILGFDLPYLVSRAQTLRVDQFPFLGRLRGKRTEVEDTTFSSKAHGTHKSHKVHIAGRIVLDLLPMMRREHKLRSYTLNAVAEEFLQQKKEDVHHSMITVLHNGTNNDRRILARYCLKDALLPQRLLDKLLIVVNHAEMARVTGVPFSWLLTRGQQIKVHALLLRYGKRHKKLLPAEERQEPEGKTAEVAYEGAIVLEPKRGFYTTPIATLDYKSLYPSIIIAQNLCYSTLVQKDVAKSKLSTDDFTVTPMDNYFVKPHVSKGILPAILEELLAARKRAKADMRQATNPFTISVLNGRQLALKITANSVYGFTGALIGILPCLEISSSVTAFGRAMIAQTQQIVEDTFRVSNGYEHDATVIYGDTDSVMVEFGTTDIAKAIELGKQAATLVTKQFPHPIELEFEKIFMPYLLMNKKRYAGLMWTSPDQPAKMDVKGLETVRRDNCKLVKHVVQRVLEILLEEQDPDKALEFVKCTLRDLLNNRIDLSELIISKALGKLEYKTKLPHVELAKRMLARDPGSAPAVGERVPYVIVRGAHRARQFEKSEDPMYALTNNIPIDANYYIEHQLKLPLERIFAPIIGDTSRLFQGDHMRTITIVSSKTGPLSQFLVRLPRCLGCRCLLKNSETPPLCPRCQPDVGRIHGKYEQTATEAQARYDAVWDECLRCQGSREQAELCVNKDCTNLYRRVKATKERDSSQRDCQRFVF